MVAQRLKYFNRALVVLLFILALATTFTGIKESNGQVSPGNIRIDPNHSMWFEDNGKHPYLVGVSESDSFSNFWGDPAEEWDREGKRKTEPVTHPTAGKFLWSEYLDTLAAHGMTCVREMVLPDKLEAAAGYAHHYNPYPFPWARIDAKKTYLPGYRENEKAKPGTPGRINWEYLHSAPTPDYSRPQEGYFEYRVRRFCLEAKKRKIYVILTIFPINPYFEYEPDNAAVKAYIDMLLGHTMDLGNVLYEINWEGGNGDHFNWWARYVKDKLAAAGRPTNVILVNHSLVKPRVNHKKSRATIVGHHRAHSHRSILESRSFGKPVIWTEDFDEGKRNAHTTKIAEVVRDRTWYSFVAGVHHIWYDWSMRLGTYKDATFFEATKSLVNFLSVTDVPFWTMAPNDTLAKGEENWCLANPGCHYLVYFGGGVGRGTRIAIEGGPFKSRWFDPKSKPSGAFIGKEFDAPENGFFHSPEGSFPEDKLVLYVYGTGQKKQN